MAYQKYNLYLTCVTIAKIVFKLNTSLTELRNDSMYKFWKKKIEELNNPCVLKEGSPVAVKEK